MAELDPRIRAADRNFIASFEKLIGLRPGSELRRIGSTVVWDSRITNRNFNGVAVLEPTTADDLRTALDWIASRQITFSAWIREDLVALVEKTVLEAGLEPDDEVSEPVMVIRPPAEVPEPPAGVSVREAVDEAMLEDHMQSTMATGFPEDLTRQIFGGPWWLDDPDVRMFTAYVEGRPAGNSLAIRSGDVSGIFSVGVPEELRGRGIGSAVTWAAVDAGREWGCELVALQSSPMGFGVYRRMGFEVLTHYAIYREADESVSVPRS